MSITAERPEAAAEPAPSGRRRFPWLAVVTTLAVALYLVSLVPRYYDLDPGKSVIPLDRDIPIHYALLFAHVVTGSVASIAGLLQLWPRLRRRHPAAHRVIGYGYVYAGIVPTVVLAPVIMPMGLTPAFGQIGIALWTAATAYCTWRGWRATRRGDHAEHRRWFLYSFASLTGVITGRLLFYLVIATLGPGLALGPLGAFVAFWISWPINLAIAHWWLRRHPATGEKPSGIRPEHH